VTNSVLVSKVRKELRRNGYHEDNTLLATSLCCDEVNRPLEHDFTKVYGDQFSMGGLAGFPFAGLTGFKAMSAHIPDDGSCLIVYGPHCGVNSEGMVGTVSRRGKENGGTCCGSAVAAAEYVSSMSGFALFGRRNSKPADPILDAQQAYVGMMLRPYAERLEKAPDPMVELPYCLFEEQDKLMHEIVRKGSSSLGANKNIALLGGIQINTPREESDYFLPLRFEIRDSAGRIQTLSF